MNITVIGPGRWGSFIAWYLKNQGFDVLLYGRQDSPGFQELIKTKRSELLVYPDDMRFSMDLHEALAFSDIIVISIGSQNLRGLLSSFPADMPQKKLVLCMKGLEVSTGMRLTEVVGDVLHDRVKVAVWVGPGHVEEFSRGVPNCMVIDSVDKDLKKELVGLFSSELIRFYYGDDLIGNELGAASKNVIGIAAGMLDGFGVSSLKGALMSRGTREIARLIKAMGGNELTAYGLSHLGDYEATVFSKHSHNRRFGECVIKGEHYDKLAEGYYTVKALCTLGEKYGVDLPICKTVNAVLYENADPKTALDALFTRSIKEEFYD